MTQQEKKAILNLNKALRECDALGIKLSGMDDNLMYATKEAVKIGEKIRAERASTYCPVACPVACANQSNEEGTGFLYSGCYQDSGGW